MMNVNKRHAFLNAWKCMPFSHSVGPMLIFVLSCSSSSMQISQRKICKQPTTLAIEYGNVRSNLQTAEHLASNFRCVHRADDHYCGFFLSISIGHWARFFWTTRCTRVPQRIDLGWARHVNEPDNGALTSETCSKRRDQKVLL